MTSSGETHEKLVPGIYESTKSLLVTTWDIRIDTEEKISPAIMHAIEHTLESYLYSIHSNYRILGVFTKVCQSGFYVVTRFVDRYDIFQIVVDYIMHLQRVGKVNCNDIYGRCQSDDVDLIGAKRVMLNYYEKHLKYYNSATLYD